MKELFKIILFGAPLAALVLYFSLTCKEEIKTEQRIREATHAVESQKFDDDFADAFNNTPIPGAGVQVQKTRAANLDDLEKKAAQARERHYLCGERHYLCGERHHLCGERHHLCGLQVIQERQALV